VAIWHITKSVRGGAGQYALRLSHALNAAGHESHVLVPAGSGNEVSQELEPTNPFFPRLASRIHRSLVQRISLTGYHSPRGIEKYLAPLEIRPPDIIHLHGLTGWIGLRGLRQLIPPRTSVFQTTHSPWDVSGGCLVAAGATCFNFTSSCSDCPALANPWKSLARRDLHAKRQFICEYSVQPIANGEWMAEVIRQSAVYKGISDIPIIPPIVDDAYFQQDIESMRDSMNIADDALVLGLGARSITDPFKGIASFLSALAQRPTLCKKLTILLFGEGNLPLPSNLDVRRLGAVDDPGQLAKLYRTSDLFVSPSQMETFGMTLLEAQASGSPVAAFEVGGVRAAVCPELRGDLVPVNDWARLLDIIEARARNRISGDSIQRLRTWARGNFNSRHIAHLQTDCYAR
jgi:glycosyltransferase involved in cell wall biosynthesis